MIRELITFLTADDYLNFVQTCTKFSKFAFDPYIKHSVKLDEFQLDPTMPTIHALEQKMFFDNLSDKKIQPLRTNVTDSMCLNAFYYNPARQLLYSYFLECLKISKLDKHGVFIDYQSSVPAIPDIVEAAGYGKQIYFVSLKQFISLHEGQIENLQHSEWLDWSSKTLTFPRRLAAPLKLGILDEGRKVLLGQRDVIQIFNYNLEIIKVLPLSSGYSFYIPTPTSRAYVVNDRQKLRLFYTYPSEPMDIYSHFDMRISNIQACKYGSKQGLLFMKDRNLMLNKKDLGYCDLFTTYKHHLFMFLNSELYTVDLNSLDSKTKVPVNFRGTNPIWMRADNYKLMILYKQSDQIILGIIRHNEPQVFRFHLGLEELGDVYLRENMLFMRGEILTEADEMSRKTKMLLLNLNKTKSIESI